MEKQVWKKVSMLAEVKVLNVRVSFGNTASKETPGTTIKGKDVWG